MDVITVDGHKSINQKSYSVGKRAVEPLGRGLWERAKIRRGFGLKITFSPQLIYTYTW